MKQVLSIKDWEELVSSTDNFMFDMDGVLFGGSTVFKGVPEALQRLRNNGKNIVFVTNNATKSRAAYEKKLADIGIPGVSRNEIFGSAYAVVCYLDSIGFDKTNHSVFTVGDEGLVEELMAAGYKVAESVAGPYTSVEELCEVPLDASVRAVVCGFAGNLSYRRLAIAHAYLCNHDVLFIATNMDSTYPGPGGRTFPGSGSLTSVLINSTARKPVVVGKPERLLLELVFKRFNFDPARTCMVGDRLDTDIAFGKSGGCKTLLVHTGCTTPEMLKTAPQHLIPDYAAPGLGDYGLL